MGGNNGKKSDLRRPGIVQPENKAGCLVSLSIVLAVCAAIWYIIIYVFIHLKP